MVWKMILMMKSHQLKQQMQLDVLTHAIQKSLRKWYLLLSTLSTMEQMLRKLFFVLIYVILRIRKAWKIQGNTKLKVGLSFWDKQYLISFAHLVVSEATIVYAPKEALFYAPGCLSIVCLLIQLYKRMNCFKVIRKALVIICLPHETHFTPAT